MNDSSLAVPEEPGGLGLRIGNFPEAIKEVPRYSSVEELVRRSKPAEPVQLLRPQAIVRAATWFTQHFPGDVMYSVKSNPDDRVLRLLRACGIKTFDVASIREVRQIYDLFPETEMYFMHPVKSPEAIAEAYFRFGVRHFSLDSQKELEKIMKATADARDLTLHIRLDIRAGGAAYDLSGKFGVPLHEASRLMRAVSKKAARLGLCFHVGSQCMDPAAYRHALAQVRDLMRNTKLAVDFVDVGGGFPSIYPDLTPPSLISYMDAIREAVAEAGLPASTRLLCEPGRALVAEGGSVLVRVELRKGDRLYINDGTFGSLFDAGVPAFKFPCRAFRGRGKFGEATEGFSLFGPTCDSMDSMKGPFVLPADIKEGDWIEIGQLGAYGAALRTQFNGFHSDATAVVVDAPMLSMY